MGPPDGSLPEGKELAGGGHSKLLRLVSKEIDQLAAELGFSPRQVVEREFRAERVNGRIVRLISDRSVRSRRAATRWARRDRAR